MLYGTLFVYKERMLTPAATHRSPCCIARVAALHLLVVTRAQQGVRHHAYLIYQQPTHCLISSKKHVHVSVRQTPVTAPHRHVAA